MTLARLLKRAPKVLTYEQAVKTIGIKILRESMILVDKLRAQSHY